MLKEGFAERLAVCLEALASPTGNARVKFLPVLTELLQLDDDSMPIVAWLRQHFVQSIETLLKAGLSSEELAALVRDIIYMPAGIKGDA